MNSPWGLGPVRWLTRIILDTQEAEINQPRQIICESLSPKKELAELLKALSSNCSSTKKKSPGGCGSRQKARKPRTLETSDM
jgi:hypothetical protein